ncbi:MAG: exonuclease domain-containing protein, partial [Anaerolineae bacterium]
MNRTYVALDLETTGLDPERDAIIEVGAVRFRTSLRNGSIQAQVLDTWSTFVNPGRPIPIQVQQLTGIHQNQVDGAPHFPQVMHELRRFVGQNPVIGHNVQFDLSFLDSHRLPLSNPSFDTFELAGVLVPHADRYSLQKLGRDFDLADVRAHRALEDAMATKDLFVALLTHASELPRPILQEINRLAAKTDWPLKDIFRSVERGLARTAFSGAIGQQLAAMLDTSEDALGPLFAPVAEDEDELVPAARPRALDVDALAAMLEEGGLFSRNFPGFEHRPQQVEMLRAVADALNGQQHLMVEGGTGTGK